MPHSIHHEFYEPSVPENALTIQESSSGSKWLNNIHKGKGHQSSHTFIALNPQDPYELGGTPIEQHQNAKSAQQEISEPYQMISEATVGLIAALQKFNYAHLTCRQTDIWLGEQDVQLVTAAQRALGKFPPTTKPDPLSYDGFLQLLNDEGLMWLLGYVDQLDSMADFSVAPTADPNKKRCKVGRPIGKILKQAQNDDLVKRLMKKAFTYRSSSIIEILGRAGRPMWTRMWK
ncbi:unnamed protein product [Alternaria alternata]